MNRDAAMNEQLVTRWADPGRTRLVTRVERAPAPRPGPGEILVRPLRVPLHGSFWMATRPDASHPRVAEFMAAGRFVFGNGGLARVQDVGPGAGDVAPGDYVAVFGHIPCARPDCECCRGEGRFVECPSGESAILGHGKTAPDGMLATHCLLPAETWVRCARAGEVSGDAAEALAPQMFAFLAADVRNALTRDPDLLRRRRVVLVGAGLSGRMAARLILDHNPEARILAVDVAEANARALADLDPARSAALALDPADPEAPARLAREAEAFFRGRPCDLLLECSSGHTTPLWAHPGFFRPGLCCLLFGFGLRGLTLTPALLQCSGVKILTSRGVGTADNRRETVRLLAGPFGDFVRQHFVRRLTLLPSLEEVARLVAADRSHGTAVARGLYCAVPNPGDPENPDRTQP